MFKEILGKIVSECAGGVGAILMGYDGIAIDEYVAEDVALDINLVAVEYSNVAKEIRKAADILETGDLQEVSIKTDQYYVVIYALTDEYFVALALQRDGNFGQGRYLLMREAGPLLQALE